MVKKKISENRINEIVDKDIKNIINEHLSTRQNDNYLALESKVPNEMVNLSQRKTGINTRIYISSKEGQHEPRIKVYNSNNDESFSLSIEDTPRVLGGNPNIVSNKIFKQSIRWVQINKEILLYYWQHPEMYTDDLLEKIQKVQ
jgi:hypothetical protein